MRGCAREKKGPITLDSGRSVYAVFFPFLFLQRIFLGFESLVDMSYKFCTEHFVWFHFKWFIWLSFLVFKGPLDILSHSCTFKSQSYTNFSMFKPLWIIKWMAAKQKYTYDDEMFKTPKLFVRYRNGWYFFFSSSVDVFYENVCFGIYSNTFEFGNGFEPSWSVFKLAKNPIQFDFKIRFNNWLY